MKYLSSNDISNIALDWNTMIDEIEKATRIFSNGNFSQPIKPYLRYNNLVNRIIAMPAHIGEEIGVAGIKWIASFPGNIDRNLKRAHSTIILNEENTGVPFAILNTPLVSGIRTASVTGVALRKYLELRGDALELPLTVGMTGLGPIGQLHLQMMDDILGDKVVEYLVYDLKPELIEKVDEQIRHKVKFVDNWESIFDVSDIFCTCTVSKEAYVDRKPKPKSLHLNVSLRDYKADFMDHVDVMIVDDWEEVCREKTDIEIMHLDKGLQKEDTSSLAQFLFETKTLGDDEIVMFNPMGMAIYDLAISKYIYGESVKHEVGVELED